MVKIYFKAVLLLFLMAPLFACEKDDKAAILVRPAAISAEDECALDGMIVANYPGPKAQILYREEGKRDFFCETKELFHLYAEPGMAARVAAIYVQDTAGVEWEKPVNNWIDAKGAYYVVGGTLEGSMGPTYAPFKTRETATPFVKEYGGEIMTFDEVINMIGG